MPLATAASQSPKSRAIALSFPQLSPDRIIHVAELLLLGVVFLMLADRMFRLISQYAVNIFFSDQWEFNDATFFQKHSLWQMFTWQHGPHRQGLGALFAKLIEPHFAWNSRIESFVVGGVIVSAAMCALYLKKRLYGRLSVSDVLIPAIFFIPAQYETLFVTANFAHGPFPLLLIMLYCLAWTCQRSAIRYSLVLIINFVTIYTGFGLFLGILTPVLLALDYCSSAAEARPPKAYVVVAIVVSLASLGSFFLGYKFNADLDCFSPQPLPLKYYVVYVAFMFANFFSVRAVAAPLQLVAGMTALIALLASLATATWQLLRTRGPNLPIAQKRLLIVVALIAFCLLFCMSAAYGRACSGLANAMVSRYVIYLEVGVLGLYLHLLNIRWAITRRFFLAGLLAAVLFATSYVNRLEMGYFSHVKRDWRRCYLLTENADMCSQAVGFPIYTHPPARTRLQEKLDFLKKTRQNFYADTN